MPATTRLALPYPAGTDPADVPADLGALAGALDGAALDDQGLLSARPVSTPGTPGVRGRYWYATDQGVLYRDHGTGWTPFGSRLSVTDVLPAAPIDGQQVLLSPGLAATDPVYSAVYRASSGLWHVTGGPELFDDAGGTVDGTAASYFVTGDPAVSRPWPGTYRVTARALALSATAQFVFVGTNVPGLTNTQAAIDGRAAVQYIGGGYQFSVERTVDLNLAAATGPVAMAMRNGTSGQTATFGTRRLTLRPLTLVP